MLMNYNKNVADQGRKVLYAITKVCTDNYFIIETQVSVVDTFVSSVINYASEIWGFHQAPDVEKLHTSFCNKTLGEGKTTCNSFIYQDLERFPLSIVRKFRLIKY